MTPKYSNSLDAGLRGLVRMSEFLHTRKVSDVKILTPDGPLVGRYFGARIVRGTDFSQACIIELERPDGDYAIPVNCEDILAVEPADNSLAATSVLPSRS